MFIKFIIIIIVVVIVIIIIIIILSLSLLLLLLVLLLLLLLLLLKSCPLKKKYNKTNKKNKNNNNNNINTNAFSDSRFIIINPQTDLKRFLFQQENDAILCRKGDFVFSCAHVVELVAKAYLAVQNFVGKPPDVHIANQWDLDIYDIERAYRALSPPPPPLHSKHIFIRVHIGCTHRQPVRLEHLWYWEGI